MKPAVRWLVAALVTVAAFASVTWICGAVVLAAFMGDVGARWGIAGALGVAVAALAALWGHAFATREVTPETGSGGDISAALPGSGSGSHRNVISGGTFHGPVAQGRDISIAGPVSGGAILPQDHEPGSAG